MTTRRTFKLEFHVRVDDIMAGSSVIRQSKTILARATLWRGLAFRSFRHCDVERKSGRIQRDMIALICTASVIFGAWLWWRFPVFYDLAGEAGYWVGMVVFAIGWAAYAAAVCLRILDDLKNDPIEGHNVAGDPAHATDLAHFRARLATLKKEAGGASIEQLKNMPYGEPKSDRKNKAGED